MKITRKLIFTCLGGFATAFCIVAGSSFDKYDNLDWTGAAFYRKLFIASVAAIICTYAVWEGLTYLRQKKPWEKRHIFKKTLKAPKYWACVLLLLLCWLPALLSIFPGVFAYDAYDEWQQIVSGTITSHHPVLHVLVLGGLVEGIHALTGSYNAGIVVYSILQMFLLANIFAYSIRLLAKLQKVSPIWQYIALAFYCLSPVIQLFSICATKDVLFAGAQLLFYQFVFGFYYDRKSFFAERGNRTGFALSAFFTMTMRNNGLYIVIIVCGIMACSVLLKDKQYRKGLLLPLFFVFLAYGMYTGPFYRMLSVKSGGIEEMLSVPIQQMARVYRYDYESLDSEEVELLYKVLPKEYLESYRPTVSDFVKRGFQREAFEAEKKAYLKLWVKWGLEHPLTYINSFFINTVDGWYPFAVVDGYRNDKNNFYDYRVAEPGTEVVLLPSVHAYYEAISHDRAVQENGWSFLFLSPGWYFLMFLHMFLYAWSRKKYADVIAMLVMLLNFLTVLLGPMALVRYVLIFYYGFPAMLATGFRE